MFAISVWGGTI